MLPSNPGTQSGEPLSEKRPKYIVDSMVESIIQSLVWEEKRVVLTCGIFEQRGLDGAKKATGGCVVREL